jgi:copper chaperone CopZ
MLNRAILACVTMLFIASAASGAGVTYVLQTPGVVWGGTSAKARAAVEKIAEVRSVDTDMNLHTVTVEFDDEQVSLEDIIHALNEAGYTVPDHSRTP